VGALEGLAIASVSARVFGALLALPFGEALHILPRLCIALCLGLAIAPDVAIARPVAWYWLAIELFIGFILVSPIRILSEAFEMLGEWIDTARGQTISSVMDPLNGQQSSDLATLFRLGATTLVIALGGLERVVEALYASYLVFKVGTPPIADDLLSILSHSGLQLLSATSSLCCVWLLAYLLTDLYAAIFAKNAHGLSFTTTSTFLKMFFTFVLLLNLVNDPHQIRHLIEKGSRGLFEQLTERSRNLSGGFQGCE